MFYVPILVIFTTIITNDTVNLSRLLSSLDVPAAILSYVAAHVLYGWGYNDITASQLDREIFSR
jgi:hypothetical protein